MSTAQKARYFDAEFWPVVWLKKNKAKAKEAFVKLVKTRDDAERLARLAREQGPLILAEAEKNGHSPLHVSPWLNQARFEDEWGEPKGAEPDPFEGLYEGE
jgi:hypothetical protein